MNIGIVTTWFERGAAYVSRQFMDVLAQKHKVYIYARGGETFAKGNPKWDLPNVYWSKYPINSKYIEKEELCRWLKENQIELVLFNEQNTFKPILWCKELGVKTMAYIDYYKEKTIPLFNVYDALVCNTRRHLSAFEDHPNAIYVPWGTDTNIYKPFNDDGKLVEEGKVTFFNSAGMNPLRKGTDSFIRALTMCEDRRNIKALIHTQVNLREFFPQLASSIDGLINEGVLELVEKTIPAPGLYYKADVYVYPSILDGIGLTVPEAISSGLACIASNNPPMNEFVNDDLGALIPINRLYARNDGYYWPQCRCDVNALREIICKFASAPLDVVKMKKRARLYALDKLSFEKNATSILDKLESIQLIEVDDRLRNAVDTFDGSAGNKLVNFIMKYKLYRLPIKFFKRAVGYHGLYK